MLGAINETKYYQSGNYINKWLDCTQILSITIEKGILKIPWCSRRQNYQEISYSLRVCKMYVFVTVNLRN